MRQSMSHTATVSLTFSISAPRNASRRRSSCCAATRTVISRAMDITETTLPKASFSGRKRTSYWRTPSGLG